MLNRLAAAQQATTNSLQAAQDFAANAAHELRTPLTAMRADLDTLRIHDLPAEERAEVVQDLSRAQRRVEAIITALGQLASGQLAQAEDRELIDVADMLDRVARENMRTAPGVEIVVEAGDDLGTIWGWPGGLRLAVDNLVRNAVTHGRATRIVLAAHRRGQTMTIIVDDNGSGLPEEEHQAVLGRFSRGSNAAPGGSGLGLALVAQQAALHGGHIELSNGPLGGLRATLTISTSPAPPGDSDSLRRAQRGRRAAPTQQQHRGRDRGHYHEARLYTRRCRLAQQHSDHHGAHPHGQPGWRDRERVTPSADQQPADGGPRQKRPCCLCNPGHRQTFGVAAAADRAEDNHAHDVGEHGDQRTSHSAMAPVRVRAAPRDPG
jgi:two-component sensor histidine kinase